MQTSNHDMTARLGRVLQQARKRANLRQADVARLLGDTYNQANVSRIEAGKQVIDVQQLFTLAPAFGVTASLLIMRAERAEAA